MHTTTTSFHFFFLFFFLIGWPSFFDLIKEESITLTDDFSYGMHRVETSCSQVCYLWANQQKHLIYHRKIMTGWIDQLNVMLTWLNSVQVKWTLCIFSVWCSPWTPLWWRPPAHWEALLHKLRLTQLSAKKRCSWRGRTKWCHRPIVIF